MTKDEATRLCLELLHADREDDVIQILERAGLWSDQSVWRLYGDRDGNFATIGNQQSRPEAALVEKLVNSVDARLMNACYCAGIDPRTPAAPKSIREAVARFFAGRERGDESGGSLREWHSGVRTEQSQYITLAATGSKSRPCLTIADWGEGQTPDRMPETFLSLDRDNKLRIAFVQGKFNMGGTGALKFCGTQSLQLIVSRRNPDIARLWDEGDPSASLWGFTIVRRERPTAEAGAVRNSQFTYLAPINARQFPRRGGVLRFRAESLRAMPELNEPYAREMRWGSVLKLYNYDMKGFSSHILMKTGLLYRLEILLPEIALPVRLHECRDYGGKKDASFVTTLSGLTVRLEDGRGGNLEDGYPTSVPFSVHGEKMLAKIYAFSKGRADTYRTNEGVVFTMTGQTHGAIPKSIFHRNAVKMGRLADSLLVVVDCSSISVAAREDLFMNSRDRLSNGELRKAVERQLEEILAKHPGLRELREVRRSKEIADRLHDSKPLEEVLTSILKSSPSLAALFLTGHRLSQPHRPPGSGREGTRGSDQATNGQFVGKPHPTFFQFHRRKKGELLRRECEIGQRCRLTFETDVENGYFTRAAMPGRFEIEVVDGGFDEDEVDHTLTLHDGVATWSVELPESAAVGDEITLQCSVHDDVLLDALVNVAKLRVKAATQPRSGSPARRSRRGGRGGDEGKENPSGLELPHIERVREAQWSEYNFDRLAACAVIEDAVGEGSSERSAYTFYVNVDNLYLKSDIKDSQDDPQLIESKFVYGNVLVALALIRDFDALTRGSGGEKSDSGSGMSTKDEVVRRVTRALSAFMVPMINNLGGLSSNDIGAFGDAGDDD